MTYQQAPDTDDSSAPPPVYGFYQVPVEDVVTIAVLLECDMLKSVTEKAKAKQIFKFCAVVATLAQACIIYLIWSEVGHSIVVPDECPSMVTVVAQAVGLFVVVVYNSQEFGNFIIGMELMYANGSRPSIVAFFFNTLHVVGSLLTTILSAYIIRASENPVDVLKDCLSMQLIVDLPGGIIFAAMKRGMLGRVPMFTCLEIDTVDYQDGSGKLCFTLLTACYYLMGLSLASLLTVSSKSCDQWCEYMETFWTLKYFASFGPKC